MNPKSEEKSENTTSTAPVVADVESGESLTFSPPVYAQRYQTIASLLNEDRWRKAITTVVDFGCSEFKFFKHLKSLTHLTHIYAVDVDETLMGRCQYEAKPMLYEYISHYNRDLTVDLFVGSIAEPDSRLVGVDAVVCIELIEHLYPETLEKVPYTVFECMRPKLAVFTTPNSDFNVMFNLEGFRHYDHKFEWSRKEFEDWCHNLLLTYKNYDVYFQGIGRGPEGTDHLGCVSQMAVFTRREDLDTNLKPEGVTGTPYKLFSRIEYPFVKDERNEDQKESDEIKYLVNKVMMYKSIFEKYHTEDGCEIPVSFLRSQMTNFFSDEQTLKKKLLTLNYEVGPNQDGVDVVTIIEEDYNSYSDDSEDDDYDCDSTLNISSTEDNEKLCSELSLNL